MSVTAKALREALAEVPDDTLIVLSCDPEGNHFSLLYDTSPGFYVPGASYGHEFLDLEDSNVPRSVAPTALCLWPS